MLSFEDFKKIEIKIGTVISAEKVEGSDKLLKLIFDLGSEKRQILAGIAQFYEPTTLLGKQVPLVVNLEPRTLMGQVSDGMMLAAIDNETPVLLHPERQVPPGSTVR